MSKLLNAAVELYIVREREQTDRFFASFNVYEDTGEHIGFENTNAQKIWFWACKRWRNFPDLEYEARIKREQLL